MDDLKSKGLEKLKRMALKLVLLALGDPDVSDLESEAKKFDELWKQVHIP